MKTWGISKVKIGGILEATVRRVEMVGFQDRKEVKEK